MSHLVQEFFARVVRRGVRPWIPNRRKLALDVAVARFDRESEIELQNVSKLGPNRGTAIDIGANNGLYTYQLSNLYDHVHAFEIHPELSHRLSTLVAPNVTVHNQGLSSKTGSAVLKIPRYQNRQLLGWGSLENGNCEVADSYDLINVSTITLDSLSIESVSFIKADIEGHEFEMLLGAVETMNRCRPVIFIEIKDGNLLQVRRLLSTWNYVEKPISTLLNRGGSAGNYLFLPHQP